MLQKGILWAFLDGEMHFVIICNLLQKITKNYNITKNTVMFFVSTALFSNKNIHMSGLFTGFRPFESCSQTTISTLIARFRKHFSQFFQLLSVANFLYHLFGQVSSFSVPF